MARHVSFDDPRVGQKKGNGFRPSGTKDRPQRIAWIPYEATAQQLVPSDQLKSRANRQDAHVVYQRAEAGDPRARAIVSDMEEARSELAAIARLEVQIKKRLKSQPPSAELWTNERGQRVILYPDTVVQDVVWVDAVGPVLYREEVPKELWPKQPETVYGFVILIYELDEKGDVAFLSPEHQVDLGGGHKLAFEYELQPWAINDAKADAWKEQSRRFPVIFNDYEVYQVDKESGYPKTKFIPAGPAIWRQDPVVMQKVIREARRLYPEVPQAVAKDFSAEQLVELLDKGRSSGRGRSGGYPAPSVPDSMQDIDLAAMLGGGDFSAPSQDPPAALENNSSDLFVEAQVTEAPGQDEFAGLIPGGDPGDDAMAHLFPQG